MTGTHIASLTLYGFSTFAADEICATCGPEVSVSGDFAHYKIEDSVAITGAGDNAAGLREEIYGQKFAVTIAHLPAGKYTIRVGGVEVYATAPGQRIFSVKSGDVSPTR